MSIEGLHLTEQEQTALETMAQRVGKTPDEIVRDAGKQLIAQFQSEDRLSLLRQARGMWKDRTGLPAQPDLRRGFDPLPPRGEPVSNELIDKLREDGLE
jgi:hypothetical protein